MGADEMPTALVVDDSEAICYILSRLLSRAGYEVTLASTGIEALALAGEKVFDVAIVDQGIPAPRGMEVLTLLMDMQPDCLRLLITGALDPGVATQAMLTGVVSRAIAKPFTPGELLQAITDARAERESLRPRVEVRHSGVYAGTMASAEKRAVRR